ncbi:Fc receptor-like protein 5 [Clarias gariepinus]
MTEGDSVTLSCEVKDSSTNWTFSWYREIPYRHGVTKIYYSDGIIFVELLSDSRGSGGFYILSPAARKHTGVYVCRGERGEPDIYTQYSNQETLWITGEAPPVSLIINPSRTQHFTGDSLSLSCEDQSNSTGWTVRRYTHSEGVLDCSWWGLVTGSTCKISSLSTSDTGVYWCGSESGENSNPVNITVHDGNVILDSPVHPVTKGHPLTLRCLYRNTKPSNLRADFYKNGSVLQTQTRSEMIIYNVSKSDEAFYNCKSQEKGESPKIWVSVGAKPKPTVRVNPQSSIYTGDTVTLTCELNQGTEWEFLWYKNDQQLQRFSTEPVNTNTLPVTVDNTGDTVYKCVARRYNNGADTHYYTEYSDEVTITAKAKPKPTVRVNPQSSIYTGDTVTLTCELQESTGWEFLWYKYNQPLQDFSTEPVNTNTLSVTVNNTGDSVYKCRARRGEAFEEYYTDYSNEVMVTARGSLGVEAPISVLMLISSVVTASPYLLVTIILLLKCYRARAHTQEKRIGNPVTEE